MTITLHDGDLTLTIAPERGAEARSLEAGGVELLYQAPWSPAPLPPGPIDALPWEQAWRGGWQLLWPNAGAACTVDAVPHGFHGGGSVAEFSVIEQDMARVLLGCELGGLVCERGFALRDGRVRATASIRNDGAEATSLILVEHLILGGRLAAEGTSIALEGGRVIGQEWDGTPAAAVQAWPLLGEEDLSVLPATTSRFVVVRELAAGTARVTAPDGLTLDLHFDRAAFPHLWLWEERFGATQEPWNGEGECLAVEPASVPSTDGLAGAIERGEATELAPGAVFEGWCELIPGRIGDST
jgi:galactose mutarotase-like enzyme